MVAARVKCSVGFGILALLLPVLVAAQDTTSGTIAGVVKDASGAVLPGVTVEAASPALIERVRSVVTDGEGRFRIIDLRPGTYTVTCTLTGFKTVVRTGIELTTGFTATVNAELAVGSVEETITVSGEVPVVDTQSVTVQKVFSGDTIRSLPIGRNAGIYTALLPGATQGNLANQDVGGTKGESTQQFAIHGGRGWRSKLASSGNRKWLSRTTGCGSGPEASRTVRRGLSASTVPMPTRIASCAARS